MSALEWAGGAVSAAGVPVDGSFGPRTHLGLCAADCSAPGGDKEEEGRLLQAADAA